MDPPFQISMPVHGALSLTLLAVGLDVGFGTGYVETAVRMTEELLAVDREFLLGRWENSV